MFTPASIDDEDEPSNSRIHLGSINVHILCSNGVGVTLYHTINPYFFSDLVDVNNLDILFNVFSTFVGDVSIFFGAIKLSDFIISLKGLDGASGTKLYI